MQCPQFLLEVFLGLSFFTGLASEGDSAQRESGRSSKAWPFHPEKHGQNMGISIVLGLPQ